MLSLNPESIENSLIELDEEELEAIERKQRLLDIAGKRRIKQNAENNLAKAAALQKI